MFIASIVILFLLLGGLTFVAGEGRASGGGLGYRAAGALMVTLSVTVMLVTVARWAKYVFAVSILALLKGILALAFGYTVSQPRLTTNRLTVALIVFMLGAIVLLSYRYVEVFPERDIEKLALVGIVVGVCASMLTEPNFWLLFTTVAFLASVRIVALRDGHSV